jgi:class 3 adenylate cyclase
MQSEKLNILYVDDEEQNLVSFKAAFRRFHHVYTANSGRAGLEILQQHPIHLIVTDQRMPEMTGIQFLEKVIHLYPDTVRMILTGFSDVEVIISAINTGRVFRYITKPWDQNELRMTLDNASQFYWLQQKNKTLVEELQQKVLEQEKTLRLFQKYVPEEVVQQTLQADESDLFRGEVRHVAVLFCDVRGFTTFSEQMTPPEVVDFLNAYYSVMADCIRLHKGTVNQFVGDEIFACFGAPLLTEQNERNAVFCALEMIKRLDKLNERYAAKLGRRIAVGIGIHAGEVVAGNTGSEDRIGYSVTGDTVNTGSRIESLTREFPNAILVSETVYRQVAHLINAKAWAPVMLRGKKDPFQVYQLEGMK